MRLTYQFVMYFEKTTHCCIFIQMRVLLLSPRLATQLLNMYMLILFTYLVRNCYYVIISHVLHTHFKRTFDETVISQKATSGTRHQLGIASNIGLSRSEFSAISFAVTAPRMSSEKHV